MHDLGTKTSECVTVSRAPGRIEILGNHTDYNGGLVLSSTIDQYVWIMGVTSQDTTLRSLEYNDTATFKIDDLSTPEAHHWSNYVRGVYWAFQRRQHDAQGITGVIHGNLPQKSGLSSSAAMEIALVNIIAHISKLNILPKSKAMLAYEAERVFCGLSCSVMDQFTSQLGKQNSLLGIHCGNLMTQDVVIPENISFVVVNSIISRPANEILNKRRAECLDALSTLQEANWDIHNLSAITPPDLQSVSNILDDTLLRRVTHVVEENQRVRDGIAALKESNSEALGKIMLDSHNSSRDLFEVSHQNLETLMKIAQKHTGVLGCRLTGADLGGNLLILAKQKLVEHVVSDITQEYEHETGLDSESAICAIPGGVIVEDVSI